VNHLLALFSYSHLAPELQAVAKPFSDLAHEIAKVRDEAFEEWKRSNFSIGVSEANIVSDQTEMAIRELMVAKDAAVRAAVFASKLYFPVDGVGFGNFSDYGADGKSHNFGFTTELHTKFKYQGGETFAFEGDDDLWVYVNKQLAIDLGGIHSAMPGQVKLEEFAGKAGMVIGEIYALDLFNAERHPSGSNFTLTTSMTFVDCGVDPTIVK